jgi:hypothetical protein
MLHVMALGEARACATGEAATAVATAQRASERRWNRACAAANVEGLSRRGLHDADERGVAREPARRIER